MTGKARQSTSRRCSFRPLEQSNGRTLYRCVRCLFELRSPHPAERIHRHCSANDGLGDYVAKVLGKLGITPARVSRAIGRPCGCKKRQEMLNQLFRKS